MKLILADDHNLFRDALVQYILRDEPDAQIFTADNLGGVMTFLQKSEDVDLILLDLKMPGMNGLEGFKALRERYPDIRVALMSGVAESSDVEDALSMGAAGYFPKTLSGKMLLAGIRKVFEGKVFVPLTDNMEGMLPAYYDDKNAAPDNQSSLSGRGIRQHEDIGLTQREQDVLAHLMHGKANKEIADALGLQVVTVKLHVRGICRKLGAENRTQAVIRARSLGLVA